MVVSTARMSIGAVSKAVGIPVGTLRNWERRYGVPTPERTDGGHRLYGPETIGFLEMVNVAMRHGHRPAQLLRLSADELSALVAIDTKKGGRVADSPHTPPDVMSAIKNFDSEFLCFTLVPNFDEIEVFYRRVHYAVLSLKSPTNINSSFFKKNQ